MTVHTITVQRTIAAPVDAVWAVVDDTARYAEWMDGALAVRRHHGAATVGATYEVHHRTVGPLTTVATWTVRQVEPHRLRVDTGVGFTPFTGLTTTCRFADADGGRATEMTYEITFRLALGPLGTPLGAASRRWLAAAFARAMTNLDELVRSERPPEGWPRPVNAEVADAARQLAASGLLIGTAGNVSVRRGDRVFVTASGVELAHCAPDDVVETTLAGAVRTGRPKPTSELDLHLAIYRHTAARAVVHTHAPNATAVACATNRFSSVPVLHYQQMLLGGELRIAPYETFGSSELAVAVLAALDGRQAALMANHGSVAVGPSLATAVDNALLVEWLATLLLRVARVADPRPLTDAQQRAVVAQAIALNYGSPRENTP